MFHIVAYLSIISLVIAILLQLYFIRKNRWKNKRNWKGWKKKDIEKLKNDESIPSLKDYNKKMVEKYGPNWKERQARGENLK